MRVQEFIEGLFGADEPNSVAVIAWQTPKGFPAMPASDMPDVPGAYYTCVSKFRPNEDGGVARKAANATAIHVLMLDDIGTKAKEPPVKPTIILETSAGNYQYVYKLREPCTDFARYDALIEACAAQGWTDAAVKGCTRLFRVPGSINTKPGKGNFETRILGKHDFDRQFDLDELSSRLALSPVVVQPKVVEREVERSYASAPLAELIEALAPRYHPILRELNITGVEREKGHGPIFLVDCPFCGEHSNKEDRTAKFEPPNGISYRSWFYCHHEHCSGRGVRDVAEALNIWVESADYNWLLALAKERYVITAGEVVVDICEKQADHMQPFNTGMGQRAFAVHTCNCDWTEKTEIDGKKVIIQHRLAKDLMKTGKRVTGWVFDPAAKSVLANGKLNGFWLTYSRFGKYGGINTAFTDLFEDFVSRLVAESEWLLDWIAIKLSRPETRLPGVIFYSSEQGHGKNTLEALVRTVLGRGLVDQAYAKVARGSQFNAFYENAVLLVLNEVYAAQRSNVDEVYSFLKCANDPTMDGLTEIEGKGVDSKMAKSYLSVWVFSNHRHGVCLSKHDRRFAALETRQVAPERDPYWDQVERLVKDNREEFAASLHKWAVKRANGRKAIDVIQTEYLEHLKKVGIPSEFKGKFEGVEYGTESIPKTVFR
jgi:hypothetical protein